MIIALGSEQRARIAELHTDLMRSVETMDKLGFGIAANHVEHAIAMIEAEICPDSDETDAHIMSQDLLMPA